MKRRSQKNASEYGNGDALANFVPVCAISCGLGGAKTVCAHFPMRMDLPAPALWYGSREIPRMFGYFWASATILSRYASVRFAPARWDSAEPRLHPSGELRPSFAKSTCLPRLCRRCAEQNPLCSQSKSNRKTASFPKNIPFEHIRWFREPRILPAFFAAFASASAKGNWAIRFAAGQGNAAAVGIKEFVPQDGFHDVFHGHGFADAFQGSAGTGVGTIGRTACSFPG